MQLRLCVCVSVSSNLDSVSLPSFFSIDLFQTDKANQICLEVRSDDPIPLGSTQVTDESSFRAVEMDLPKRTQEAETRVMPSGIGGEQQSILTCMIFSRVRTGATTTTDTVMDTSPLS